MRSWPDRAQAANCLACAGSTKRVIAGISNFTDVGDVSTLANPEIVDDIRHRVQSHKLAHGEVPRELTPQEAAEVKAFGHTD